MTTSNAKTTHNKHGQHDKQGKGMRMSNPDSKAKSQGAGAPARSKDAGAQAKSMTAGAQARPWRRSDGRPLAGLALLALLWLALLPQPAPAASFDCAKAGAKIEKLICADEQLSKLDDQLAALYQEALAKTAYPDHLKAWQLQWLRDKEMGREACGHWGSDKKALAISCLREGYLARNTWFEQRLLRSSTPRPPPPTAARLEAYEQALRYAKGAKARYEERLAQEALLPKSRLEIMLEIAMPQTRPPTPEQEATWKKNAQESLEKYSRREEEKSILLRLPDGDMIRARTSKAYLGEGECEPGDSSCGNALSSEVHAHRYWDAPHCPEPLTSHIERVKPDGTVLWRKMVVHWLKEPLPSLEDCNGPVPGNVPRTFSPPHEVVISLDEFGSDPGDGTLILQRGAPTDRAVRHPQDQPLKSAYPLKPELRLDPVKAGIRLSDGSLVSGDARTRSVDAAEIEAFKRAFVQRYLEARRLNQDGPGDMNDRDILTIRSWFNEDFIQHFFQ
jgi:uncharacterized protein YecT (DUF1311 family)